MTRSLLITLLLVANLTASGQRALVQQLINSVSTDSLLLTVRQLSGDTIVLIDTGFTTIASRHANQPGNVLAEKFIFQRLTSYGLTAVKQPYSGSGVNVFAVQLGTTRPLERYIICAHYDNLPAGPVNHGADDNASGVAAVLEAARLMSNHQFPFTIMYALWDEEEWGLVGSKAFMDSHQQGTEPIHGVINLDMIGYDGNGDRQANIHVRDSSYSLMLASRMQVANNLYNTGLTLNVINPGTPLSDHSVFWNEHIAALLFIEEDITDENPNYHRITDVVDSLDMDYMTRMTKLAIATIADLASDSSAVGMEETLHSTAGFKVYPNPASDFVNVIIPGGKPALVTAILIDAQGKTCYSGSLNSLNGHFSFAVPVETQSGIYQLLLHDGNHFSAHRILLSGRQ